MYYLMGLAWKMGRGCERLWGIEKRTSRGRRGCRVLTSCSRLLRNSICLRISSKSMCYYFFFSGFLGRRRGELGCGESWEHKSGSDDQGVQERRKDEGDGTPKSSLSWGVCEKLCSLKESQFFLFSFSALSIQISSIHHFILGFYWSYFF